MAWVDNGPGWVGVLLRDADAVLALEPDFSSLHHDVGVVGLRADGEATIWIGGDAQTVVRGEVAID